MEVATITLQVEIAETEFAPQQALNELLSECEEVIAKKGFSLHDSKWEWD